MKQLLSVLTLAIALTACKPEGRVYEKHQDLSPNIEWLKTDVKVFEVPVDDPATEYKMSLSFRYANGYQYEVARVNVTEMSPSGKETEKEYVLKVRDENGDYLGEAGYDIWDSEHLVEPNKKYEESGTYTYTIEHNMPSDPLNFAMEIGMILDKVE